MHGLPEERQLLPGSSQGLDARRLEKTSVSLNGWVNGTYNGSFPGVVYLFIPDE
jgi:hypothetical protein